MIVWLVPFPLVKVQNSSPKSKLGITPKVVHAKILPLKIILVTSCMYDK